VTEAGSWLNIECRGNLYSAAARGLVVSALAIPHVPIWPRDEAGAVTMMRYNTGAGDTARPDREAQSAKQS
jgi:hypothetical protein